MDLLIRQKWSQDCERWTTKVETGLREVDDKSGDRTARGGSADTTKVDERWIY